MQKKIIIFSGDPNSINSEIIYKSLKKIKNSLRKKIYIISNLRLLKEQFKILKYSIPVVKVANLNEFETSSKLKVLDVNLFFKNPFKVDKKEASKFVKKSLNYAHEIALRKSIKGVINCAINKELLNLPNVGVTEFLASKSGIKHDSVVMLIKNKNLGVVPLTTHIDVKNISKSINKKVIIRKILTIHNWYLKKFKKKPKIAILGLNPHNSEFKSGSEEMRIIIPAISFLKKKGIEIKGPYASDTLFINEYKKFNIIVGMYHDQVLTPFKTLFKFDAINITLGLKYIRVSPDHGTAVPLIKKKIANPLSLINCINFLNNSK